MRVIIHQDFLQRPNHPLHFLVCAAVFGSLVAQSVGAQTPPRGGRAGGNGGESSTPVVAPVNVLAGLMFAQLEAGTLSPKEAWESGALTLEEVGNRLEQHGLVKDEKKPKLRDGLLLILAAHGAAWWLPELQAEPPTEPRERAPARPLSQEVRMAVADILDARNDPHALPLYQSVLQEAIADPRTRSLQEVSPVLHLARHYARHGDLKQAVGTIEAGAKLSDTAYWHDAWRIEAARLYYRMGEIAKGQTLYAQAKRAASGWLTGVAQWDQAEALIAQGNYAEARQLLSMGVDGAGAEYARVGICALLAVSYYREGEFEAARQAAEDSLAWYEKTGGKPEKGVEWQAARAQRLLDWIGKWNGKAVLAEPAAFTLPVVVKAVPKRPQRTAVPVQRMISDMPGAASREPQVELFLVVRTRMDSAVTVACPHPAIQAEIDETAVKEEFAFTRRVKLRFAPELLEEPFQTLITLTSVAAPDQPLSVPLQVASPKEKPQS